MLKLYHLFLAGVMLTNCSSEEVVENTESQPKKETLNPILKEVKLEKSTENSY
jgi:hypothetical protein